MWLGIHTLIQVYKYTHTHSKLAHSHSHSHRCHSCHPSFPFSSFTAETSKLAGLHHREKEEPWGIKPAKMLNHLHFLLDLKEDRAQVLGGETWRVLEDLHAGGSCLKSAEECWLMGKACVELTFWEQPQAYQMHSPF